MKIESNLLNISMSQSDRVQEPLKPDNSSASRKPSAHGGGGRCGSGKSGRVRRDRSERRPGGADERRPVLAGLVQSGQYQVDTAALSESIVTAAQYGD